MYSSSCSTERSSDRCIPPTTNGEKCGSPMETSRSSSSSPSSSSSSCNGKWTSSISVLHYLSAEEGKVGLSTTSNGICLSSSITGILFSNGLSRFGYIPVNTGSLCPWSVHLCLCVVCAMWESLAQRLLFPSSTTMHIIHDNRCATDRAYLCTVTHTMCMYITIARTLGSYGRRIRGHRPLILQLPRTFPSRTSFLFFFHVLGGGDFGVLIVTAPRTYHFAVVSA